MVATVCENRPGTVGGHSFPFHGVFVSRSYLHYILNAADITCYEKNYNTDIAIYIYMQVSHLWFHMDVFFIFILVYIFT